jgi:uncharacterized protein (UPF0147 family)
MPRKRNEEKEAKIVQIVESLELLLEDPKVPRNVKKALEEAKNKLSEKGDPTVRAGSAIYSITEVSNDVNLPPNARTMIWNILSLLETIK